VTPPEDGEACSSIHAGSASDAMSNTNTPAAGAGTARHGARGSRRWRAVIWVTSLLTFPVLERTGLAARACGPSFLRVSSRRASRVVLAYRSRKRRSASPASSVMSWAIRRMAPTRVSSSAQPWRTGSGGGVGRCSWVSSWLRKWGPRDRSERELRAVPLVYVGSSLTNYLPLKKSAW
jgi:hypothetical protein